MQLFNNLFDNFDPYYDYATIENNSIRIGSLDSIMTIGDDWSNNKVIGLIKSIKIHDIDKIQMYGLFDNNFLQYLIGINSINIYIDKESILIESAYIDSYDNDYKRSGKLFRSIYFSADYIKRI